MYKSYLIVVLAAMFSACGANQDKEALQEEDREAKEKLQGIWLDDNTEAAVLQVAGDTIYYADAAVAPVAFKIIGDTLTTYGQRIMPILYLLFMNRKSLFIRKLLRKIRW